MKVLFLSGILPESPLELNPTRSAAGSDFVGYWIALGDEAWVAGMNAVPDHLLTRADVVVLHTNMHDPYDYGIEPYRRILKHSRCLLIELEGGFVPFSQSHDRHVMALRRLCERGAIFLVHEHRGLAFAKSVLGRAIYFNSIYPVMKWKSQVADIAKEDIVLVPYSPARGDMYSVLALWVAQEVARNIGARVVCAMSDAPSELQHHPVFSDVTYTPYQDHSAWLVLMAQAKVCINLCAWKLGRVALEAAISRTLHIGHIDNAIGSQIWKESSLGAAEITSHKIHDLLDDAQIIENAYCRADRFEASAYRLMQILEQEGML